MVWAHVANRGGGISETSTTTCAANTTADITAGQILIVHVVTDNDGATGGINTTNALRMSGGTSGGNRWIKHIGHENDVGAAAAGVIHAWFLMEVKTTIPSGTTLTLTLGTARVAKSIDFEVFSIGAGMTWKGVGGVGTTGTGTTNPTSGACNAGTAPTTSRLWLGACAREGDNDETITQDATFTNLGTSGKHGTPNLATTANVSAVVGYKISASDTTETYDPDIGTSRDWACCLIALDEVPRSPYAEFLLGLGPRAYYRMGELVGSVCFDYAGQNPGLYTSNGGSHGYNSTSALTGDPSGDGGHLFTRGSTTTGPYVAIPDHADLDLGDGPMTILDWHQLTAAPVDAQTQSIEKGTNAYTLFIDTADAWGFYQSGVGVLAAETGTTTDTGYHFLVGAMGAGTGQKFLKDGVLGGAATDRTLANTALQLRINTNFNADSFNTGRIDEVAIFASLLTDAQLLALFNIGIGRYWRPRRRHMNAHLAQ